MLVTKATAAIQPGADDSDSETGSFDIILSAQTRDRDGDVFKASEWKMPLPDWIPIDIDHAMSVEKTVGSGKPFINDDGDLQVRGTYASTSLAQTTRTLVNEGHIRNVSVAVMVDKSLKDGTPNRELLNGAFVAVPSNREAVILASKRFDAAEDLGSRGVMTPDDMQKILGLKASDDKKPKPPYGDVTYADPGYLDRDGKPAKDGNGVPRYPINNAERCRAAWSYINMPKNAGQYTAAQLAKIKDKIKAAADKFGIEIAEDSKGWTMTVHHPTEVLSKAGARNSAADSKMIQAIHDAASLLGADCVEPGPDMGDGAAEGANKSIRQSIIVGKALAGSVEDLRDRLSDALQDVAGDDCWIWVRATFLDGGGNSGTVVYDLGEETYSRTFTDEDGLITLGGTLECVTFVTSVAPAPAPVDDDPSDTIEGSAEEHDDEPEMRNAGAELVAFRAALDALTKTSGTASPETSDPAEPPTAPDEGTTAGEAIEEGQEAPEIRARNLRMRMLAFDAERASIS